jgi:hypothetical protein
MNRKTIALLTDLALSLVLIVYILSLNPTTYTYLKNYLAALRYKLWELAHPTWLQEAMVVRGKLPEQ